jgi:hypothetical protein
VPPGMPRTEHQTRHEKWRTNGPPFNDAARAPLTVFTQTSARSMRLRANAA